MGDVLGLLLDVFFLINVLFAVIIVFSERKDPAVTWAWLMVAFILPYVGFLIYILLGFDGRKGRIFLNKSKKDDRLAKQFEQQVACGVPHGNAVACYQEGSPKFDALLRDIQSAKQFIHLQYYIVRYDDLSKRLMNALAEKARQGVEVRFLIDGMGCVLTPKRLFKPFVKAGGQLAVFLSPRFMRLNFRNHRKLAVIDGCIGYIGGLNIGNEYLGRSKRFGYWRDCHLRIEGESVHRLTLRFMMDWNFASKQTMPFSERYFPNADVPDATADVQIVSSGPDTRWPSIQHGYTKMISQAVRAVYIQTPYFVPDDSVLEAIRAAALSGVDVRIVIPAHPDHPFVYWAGLSYFGALLDAGVKCYQYERGFVHSKMIVVDSALASVGTANLDVRSFKLNFEVNAFIACEKTSRALAANFMADLQDCTEITPLWYSKRSHLTKMKESVSRLLSPIL